VGDEKAKVVGLADFRDKRGIYSTRVEEVMVNCGPFKSAILADGTVAFTVEGETMDGTPITITVNIEHENMPELARGVCNTMYRQELRLKHLRSADRWVARTHPTTPTLRLISFDDHERPFRRVEAGKRSRQRKALEFEYIGRLQRTKVECVEFKTHGPTTRAHWHCCSCGTCLIVGASMWIEEKRTDGINKTWPNAKLCDECVKPTRVGLAVVEDGGGNG
jgi:hypothetical protein